MPNFESFTNHLMSILSFASDVVLSILVGMQFNHSIIASIIMWIALQIIHSIWLCFGVKDIANAMNELEDLIVACKPWWFATNSLVIAYLIF